MSFFQVFSVSNGGQDLYILSPWLCMALDQITHSEEEFVVQTVGEKWGITEVWLLLFSLTVGLKSNRLLCPKQLISLVWIWRIGFNLKNNSQR